MVDKASEKRESEKPLEGVGAPDNEKIEITRAMILVGGRAIEDYGNVLDPFSLAEKVYIAMAHEFARDAS